MALSIALALALIITSKTFNGISFFLFLDRLDKNVQFGWPELLYSPCYANGIVDWAINHVINLFKPLLNVLSSIIISTEKKPLVLSLSSNRKWSGRPTSIHFTPWKIFFAWPKLHVLVFTFLFFVDCVL